VLGQESIALQQQTIVTRGDVGARVASTGPFLADGVEVSLDAKVALRDRFSYALGDSVLLKQDASVYNLGYNELSNKGQVLRSSVTPLPLAVMPSLPTLPAITPGTQTVVVPKGGTLTLEAGRYGTLQVEQAGTLTLKGGVYHFQSWDVDQQTKVNVLAPTEIRLAGRLTVAQQGNAYLGPAPAASGLGAQDIVLYVAGANGGSGALGDAPQAVDFGQQTTVRANVVAPNGTIVLRQQSVVTGAFLAKWVLVEQQVTLTLASHFGTGGTSAVNPPSTPTPPKTNRLFLPFVNR